MRLSMEEEIALHRIKPDNGHSTLRGLCQHCGDDANDSGVERRGGAHEHARLLLLLRYTSASNRDEYIQFVASLPHHLYCAGRAGATPSRLCSREVAGRPGGTR